MPATIRSSDTVRAAIKQTWGFDALRLIQAEAIEAGVARRDSLVVMPTGGGKSLCYQVPPLVTGKVGVVVSPLIALMKDQVDALKLVGYPAAALHSHLAPGESGQIERDLLAGDLKLLLLSPERLLLDRTMSLLRRAGIDSFAIDEAHCISQWGHDFRPEYRRLAELRQHFPGASLHAYTATATPRVRRDIAEQLQLREPTVLVGTFDRPNLAYRVLPRIRLLPQVIEILSRHERQAAIIYTISRKDAEALADNLRHEGVEARAYHAGMDAATRTRIQDEFRFERTDVVVATVAFGMGIDRSDVRCVIHAAMPKSVEAYQQETGRAGRDGLPAECVMLYSGGDLVRWKKLITRSAEEQQASSEYVEAQIGLLEEMQRVCAGVRCRHRALSEYFGQDYLPPAHADASVAGCGACDVCLGEMDEVPDSTTIARKVLSCVARVNQSFGARHVVSVLRGRPTAKVVERGHDKLSTFGLLRESQESDLLGYIDQLIDLGVLARAPGEYPVLTLTPTSSQLLRGETGVTLREPKKIEVEEAAGTRRSSDPAPLSAPEQAIFESLRTLRRSIADELMVPAFIVFADSSLQDMARRRPSSPAGLLKVVGVGQKKLDQFGERILAHLKERSTALGLTMDIEPVRATPAPPAASRSRSANSLRAADLFDQGMEVAEVASRLQLAESTVRGYLGEYIRTAKPTTIAPWVDDVTYARVESTMRECGDVAFKVLFEKMNAEVGYDAIRFVREHLVGLGRMTASVKSKTA